MAYTSNIPQSTDNPSDSQPQLLANFQEIDTYTSVNHVALNDGDQGKHKFMQMPEQGSAPTTAANEGALYTKDTGTEPDLFYRRESNGTEVQLTGGKTTVGAQSSVTLPSGVIMKYGTITVAAGGGTSAVTFTTPFPTAIRNVQLSVTGGSSAEGRPYIGSTPTTSGFTFRQNGGSGSATGHWLAIGD